MKTIAEIMAIKEKMNAPSTETKIVVGMATCGIAAGATPVFDAISSELAAKKVKNAVVTKAGCLGMCKLEPIVEVYLPGEEKVTYIKVTADMAKEIVDKHIIGGEIVTDYLVPASE